MNVKIIVYGFKEEESKDTLESRMVNVRLKELQAEFERNKIPVEIDKR